MEFAPEVRYVYIKPSLSHQRCGMFVQKPEPDKALRR